MKYLYFSLFLFVATCNSPKKDLDNNEVSKTTVEQVKTAPEIKHKELILVLKNADAEDNAKSLITNSGLQWSEVVYNKKSSKIAVIKVPEDKTDFWTERLKTSGEFKTVAINSKETLATLIKKAETTYLSLRKTECLGDCPVYEVTVDEEGNVVFNGLKFVNETGERTFKLSEKELSSLNELLSKSKFSEYQKSYDDPNIMDLPNTYITYKGQQIKIRLWKGIPKDLINVHEYVEGILLDKKYFD